jgi:predicted ATPase
MELVSFIEDSARFFQCQFIISTHSPFILSIRGAKIYDLDENPVDIKRWTELENVRIYYEFFKAHESEFQE